MSTLVKDLGASLSEIAELMYQSGAFLFSGARQEFERRYIAAALRDTHGNKVKAARRLGMHRNTLDRHLEAFKTSRSELTPSLFAAEQRKRAWDSVKLLKRRPARKRTSSPGAIPGDQTVRKEVRGKSPELPQGGMLTAHLAQALPSCGEKPSDPDLECGGLTA